MMPVANSPSEKMTTSDERRLNGVWSIQRDVGQAIAQEVPAKLSATQWARLRVFPVVQWVLVGPLTALAFAGADRSNGTRSSTPDWSTTRDNVR